MTEHNTSATPGADGNGDRTAKRQLVLRDCPRFEACNAAVCPLDASWRARAHLRGEPACFWLRAAVKADIAPRDGIEGRVLAAACGLVAPISDHFPDLRRRLARAATAPRKMPPPRGHKEK